VVGDLSLACAIFVGGLPDGVNSECRRCYGLDEERSIKIAGMKGFRFSLWSMFLGVAAVAIVCAALVKPTAVWVTAFQTAALGVLTFALLAALVYERSAARAFWIGFAVVGWGNLGLQRSYYTEINIRDDVSEWLTDTLHPYPSAGVMEPSLNLEPEALPTKPVGVELYSYEPPSDPARERVVIARSAFSYLVVWIWSLLFGFVGGIVAQQMYARRDRLAARASPSSSGAIS